MDPNLLQQLATRFNLGSFPKEEQERIIDELSAIVMQGVLARTIPGLGDAERKEFEQMLDDDTDMIDVFAYLRSKVPTFDTIVDDEAGAVQKRIGKGAA